MTAKEFKALPPTKLRYVEPMYARLVHKVPEGKDWLYEIKFDGSVAWPAETRAE